MNAYTEAQKNTANDILRGYADQGAKFSNEDYNQKGQWVFRVEVPAGTYVAIIGVRGGVIDAGWEQMLSEKADGKMEKHYNRMVVAKINAIGESCNFCRDTGYPSVYSIKGLDQSLSIRICPDCAESLFSQIARIK